MHTVPGAGVQQHQDKICIDEEGKQGWEIPNRRRLGPGGGSGHLLFIASQDPVLLLLVAAP